MMLPLPMFYYVLFLAGNAGKVPPPISDITIASVVTHPGGPHYAPPGVTSDGYYQRSAWHNLKTQGKRGLHSLQP